MSNFFLKQRKVEVEKQRERKKLVNCDLIAYYKTDGVKFFSHAEILFDKKWDDEIEVDSVTKKGLSMGFEFSKENKKTFERNFL